jgi:hypothetical protein
VSLNNLKKERIKDNNPELSKLSQLEDYNKEILDNKLS